MSEISHFLRPGGWKVTRTDGICTTMLPREGMILIGRAGSEYWLVWVDGSGCLQAVKGLQKGRSSEWWGTFKHEKQSYKITVKAAGKGIGGQIVWLEKKKVKAPPTDLSTTGTWGADAGGGGGGGGGTGGAVAPPAEGKPNGSGANAQS